jgi:hypothetical protein
MVSGVHRGSPPIQPMETEEEDTSNKKKEKPEGPGTPEKIVNALTNGKLSGVAMSVGVIGLAALALFYVLPNMLHIDIHSAWTSNNYAPVFWAIGGIATIGLIGIAAGTLGRSRVMREAWKIMHPAIFILGSAVAAWWGCSTLHTMIQNHQYLGGPMIWAFAGASAGMANLLGFVTHWHKRHT